MTDEERFIQRNKLIITIAVLSFIFVIVGYILLNSTINDDLYFHYVCHGDTGEPLGLFTSIFAYILFWWFIGLVPSACVFLFMLCLYDFLHRNDKKYGRSRREEEDFFYGGEIAFKATYTAILILMILHISNAVTINVF